MIYDICSMKSAAKESQWTGDPYEGTCRALLDEDEWKQGGLFSAPELQRYCHIINE